MKGGEEFLLAAGWVPKVISFERHVVLPEAALAGAAAVLRLALKLLEDSLADTRAKKEARERGHCMMGARHLQRRSGLRGCSSFGPTERLRCVEFSLFPRTTTPPQRYEKEQWLKKNEAAIRKDDVLRDIEEDKRRRAEEAERKRLAGAAAAAAPGAGACPICPAV